MTDAQGRNDRGDRELIIANEFARVRVTVCRQGNGERLLLEDTRTGDSIRLDPLEVEALAWTKPGALDEFVDPSRPGRWSDETDETESAGSKPTDVETNEL